MKQAQTGDAGRRQTRKLVTGLVKRRARRRPAHGLPRPFAALRVLERFAERVWRRMSAIRRIWLIVLVSTVLLLGAVSLALLTLPLPVSLVTPRLVAAVEEALGPGYRVTIGAAAVEKGEEGLELLLDSFDVTGPSGDTALSVSRAVVGLDGDFVLGRSVAAQRIRLVQPRLVLRIDADGAVSLGGTERGPPLFRLPSSAAPVGAPAELVGLLAAADSAQTPGTPLAALNAAEVQRASLTIEDKRRGITDTISALDLRVVRNAGGDGLAASAGSSEPGYRWSVSATLRGKPGEARHLDVGVENASVSRLAYEALSGSVPVQITGGLSGHLYARIEPDGTVPTAEARIETSDVTMVNPATKAVEFALGRTNLQMRWDGAQKVLRLVPSELATSHGRATLVGEARPDNGNPENWRFSLSGQNVVIGGGPGVQPMAVERAELAGNWDRLGKVVSLSQATVMAPGLSVVGKARVDLGAREPTVEASLAGGRASAASYLRVWPPFVAPESRAWVQNNVRRGTINGLTVAVRGPLGDMEHPVERQTAVDVDFEGVAAVAVPGLPAILEGKGTFSARNHTVELVLASGRGDVPGDKPLVVSDLRFRSDDMRPNPYQGRVSMKLDGPLSGIGHLLNSEPVKPFAPPGVDLAKAGGTASVSVALRGPMGHGSQLDQLRLNLDASASNADIDNLIGDKRLENASLKILLDDTTASLKADGRLAGAPLQLEARGQRKPTGAVADVSAAFTIDPSKMRGPASEMKVQGPVSVRLSVPDPRRLDGVGVEADITPASIQGLPGFAKPAGQAGRLAFRIEVGSAERYALQSFAAESGPVSLRGALEIDRAGNLAAAKLSTFKLSAGDDARLDAERSGNGWKLVLRGGAFDARALLKHASNEGASTARAKTPPVELDLDAKLGTLLGHNGQAIAGLDLRIAKRADGIRNFFLAGRLGQGSVEGRSTEGAERLVSVRSADAGALFRFLDLYSRMQGGQLAFDLAPGPADQPAQGVLQVREFSVSQEQALASVLASSGGVADPNAAVRRGVQFTKMRVAFRQMQGRIDVQEAAIWGPEIGATFDGLIDYAGNRVDLRGTFVPVFALNNLFGRLPVIGQILGGGANEGLLGVTFQVAGPASNPQLRVNPVSAVAPGFLRKLFEFRDQQQDFAAPAPVAPRGN